MNDTPENWDGVEEIVVASPSTVFIGGFFNNAYAKAGGTIPNSAGIAMYDATSDAMTAVGTGLGGVDKIVNGMTLAGDDIIATGQFTSVNGAGTGALRVGRWNGTSWSPIGDSTDGAPNRVVAAIAAEGNDIYIGGTFDRVKNGDVNVPNTIFLAKWDGAASDWVSIGAALNSGSGGVIEELRVIDHGGIKYLYAGGQFTSIGGVTAFNIARLNITVPGSNWEPISSGCTNGVNNAVRSIIDAGGGAIYVAGKFTDAGNIAAADRVAKFTPGASTVCTPRFPPPTDFRVAGIFETGWWFNVDGKNRILPAEALVLKWSPPAGDEGRVYALYQVTTGHMGFSCQTTSDSCTIYFPYPTQAGLPDAAEVTFTLTAISLFGDGTEVTLGPIGAPEPQFADGPLPKAVLEAEGLLRFARFRWGTPVLKNQAILTKTVWKFSRDRESSTFQRVVDPRYIDGELWIGFSVGERLVEVQFCYWRQKCFTGAVGTFKPYDLQLTSSNRKRILLGLAGTRVTVRGTAPGLASGSVIYPWIKVGNDQWKQVPNATVTVQRDGSFSWTSTLPRNVNRTQIQVRFEGGNEKLREEARWLGLTSNTLTIGGV
ncbi:MAG: hypothetical protein FGM29_07495 [Actinobacteria bacterium]|nr:hypothetical protein [Actinomycetota bacterium]